MLPAVACWGATFCSFWGIGEGGTAFPRESWSRGVGPCGPRYARGQRPLCTPLVGAQLPRPQRAGAPPRAPGSFRFTTKGTKGVPGALPLDPAGGYYHPTRKGHHSVQLKFPRGCRNFHTPATNTARIQGRGIKGGEAPFAGGPGTRRFLANLW